MEMAALTADYAASDLPTAIFNLMIGVIVGMSQNSYAVLLGSAIIITAVAITYFKLWDKVKNFIKNIF
jgi:hypothetical protein